MKLEKIKCVIFDFDGTLYSNGDWSGELDHFDKYIKTKDIFKANNIDAKRLLKLYPQFHIIQAIYAYLHQNKIDDSDFRKFDNENIANIIGDEIVFIDPDLLLELSKKYDVYMISDSAKKYLEYYMNYANIDKNIFKKYLSNQYNEETYSKVPMMKIIQDETKLQPDEIIMIGDSKRCDIMPASSVGFQTCHVKDIFDTEKIIKKLLKL